MITFNDLVKYEDQSVSEELTNQLDQLLSQGGLGNTKSTMGDTVLYTFCEEGELEGLTPTYNITQVVFENVPYGVYCVSVGSIKSLQQSF